MTSDVASVEDRSTSQTQPLAADGDSVFKRVEALSAEWSAQRQERQRRRELDPADFDRLSEAGFLLTGVPAEQGGIWRDASRSVRPVCELLRVLARADSSVALVSAMHPTVLAFWLATPSVPETYLPAWDEQRRHIFSTVQDGAWWGTLTSEPGSGGDIMQTRAVAKPSASAYQLIGDKAFGSGSGVTGYMMTLAIPECEELPDLFYLDVRNAAWDGSHGMRLSAAWDGQGMAATQSHAFRFDGHPITRAAWPANLPILAAAAQPFIRTCFTSVFVGITETAIATARKELAKRRTLRPFEQVEFARAELDGWLLVQAYEGMLRAVEGRSADAARSTVLGKLAVAELAESALTRLCRIIGGGSFSRSSSFGIWAQDVRALGFLRAPWGLAFDALIPQAADE
jgi:alkylation response protein AidB-like acyl-CoA dehydrogenase